MSTHANVAVIDLDPAAGPSLSDKLKMFGCTPTDIRPGKTAVDEIGRQRPHVVVIRAANAKGSGIDLARSLKSDEDIGSIPIVLVCRADQDDLQAEALEAGVDSVLEGGFRDIELYTRIRALSRIKVMQAELERRDETELRYGLPHESVTPPEVHLNQSVILAVGVHGPTTNLLREAIGQTQHLMFADDPQGAIEQLRAGGVDALVAAVDGDAGAWLTMCADIRDNPQLFNLPILLVVDADRFDDAEVAYDKGASDIMLRPLVAAELGARLTLLIRQQRYRRVIQEAHRRSLHVETSDGLTGLYSFGFLHDYLANLIVDAAQRKNDISVALFDVDDMAAINARHGYAGGDAVLRQIGGLIARLVRSEDLTARYGGDSFCVVMPETPEAAAEMVMWRISDVVSRTEFGVHTSPEAVSAHLKVGHASLATGDSAESLLTRARKALR